MKNNQILIAAVVVIVVGVAAFFGGMKYQQSQRSTAFAQSGFGSRQGGFRGGFPRGSGQGANGMAVLGKIISTDNGSITVQLQNGSSKIIVLPSSATISKTATGSASDLQTGTNVAVFGTTNSDGSVTAQNVQINPQFVLRGGPRMSPPPAQ